MRVLPPLLFALTAGIALAACAAAPPASGGDAAASAPVPAQDAAAPVAEEPAMTCNDKMGLWAVGKIADEALVAKVRTDTGSDRVRVIKPGMAVTMDYREDRVNIDVDADNRITAVRCG